MFDSTFENSQSPDGELQSGDLGLDRQLALVKRGHRYVFRYGSGEESKILEELVELARDPTVDLDWFDAAVLTHQLGRQMSEQLDRILKS